ncbi:hypothetical protein DdX_21487 [Ditylenchus destructor]|uniref:Uncharacterized protein n=1 Tax=Ditylenchus destructor TaxID=166010 RepID=A0AAD4QRC9_9BILA|nr:hypothetical protein DdX_21487 [Ditylenchus destructor]
MKEGMVWQERKEQEKEQQQRYSCLFGQSINPALLPDTIKIEYYIKFLCGLYLDQRMDLEDRKIYEQNPQMIMRVGHQHFRFSEKNSIEAALNHLLEAEASDVAEFFVNNNKLKRHNKASIEQQIKQQIIDRGEVKLRKEAKERLAKQGKSDGKALLGKLEINAFKLF